MGVSWTEELFGELYDNGYGRHLAASSTYNGRAARVLEHDPGRVLVVGAGFGFLNEVLRDAGVGSVAIDSSDWIAERAPGVAQVAIHHLDLRDEAVMDLGPFDMVVFDDLDPGYHDPTETAELARAADGLAPVAIHFVSEGPGHPALCWRPLEVWRQLAPHHEWRGVVG